jgi:hypothetical protein
MTNTTTTYWDLDGTSLETYAWNIETRSGSLRGTPPPRGNNQVIPFRAGQVYVPKYRDSRIITFPMWVIGQEADGTVPADEVAEFETNWDALADLFDFHGQKVLTKRWLEGMTVKSASALVEYNDGLDPTMRGRYGARVAPSVLLADPWFYEAEATHTINGAAKTTRGDHPTDRLTITFVGGTNPRLTVGTKWIQFNGSPGANDVVIDVQERSAIQNSVYVNGLITRDRFDPVWMELPVGSSTPTLSGGGSCTVDYQARFR